MKSMAKIILWTVFLGITVTANVNAAIVQNLAFKDTDIKVVLQAIEKLGAAEIPDLNIVPSPEVQGSVSIELTQVNWETALDIILRSYNLTAHRDKNIIMISPLTAEDLAQSKARQVRVFHLKYIDANDAMKSIQPIMSDTGKVSVLETTGQSGWEFGTEAGKKSGGSKEKLIRTKVLVVSDSPDRLEQMATLIRDLDVMPKQILIKTKIMEVNHNDLQDIGFDWASGATGAESSTLQAVPISGGNTGAIHNLAPTPSSFQPLTSGLTSANGGLQLMFKELDGTDFEFILHALNEKVKTNTLSAPVVMTLNNQEATILIGTQYPIIKTDVSTDTGTIIGGSLQEYKDIGIQLNVVPQIWGDNDGFINMIIHPAVSSYSTTSKVLNQSGTTLVEYPIISTREAETQLVVKDGGTVMLGGLMKDIKTNHVIGIPLLSSIPYLGNLFKRTTIDTEKIDLIIFITAHIVNPGDDAPVGVMDTTSVQSQFEKK
ncbi:MAG: secretin and TonB N-terminal domain-containing protein [Candidatus Omnitrophica bacterium]|nr:secretin and TonB N-terminal domain-containing protein [Candidatus Omnitrophota bacterium]